MHQTTVHRDWKGGYPQLVFFSPNRRNKSELVYGEFVKIGHVVEKTDLESANGESPLDLETEDDEMEELHEDGLQNAPQGKSELSELYKIALLLRSCIEEAATFPGVWPPTSADISDKAAKEITPIVLYNFLAWVLNKSDEPTLDGFVQLKKCEDRKVLSVAQDMIFIISIEFYRFLSRNTSKEPVTKHLSGSDV